LEVSWGFGDIRILGGKLGRWRVVRGNFLVRVIGGGGFLNFGRNGLWSKVLFLKFSVFVARALRKKICRFSEMLSGNFCRNYFKKIRSFSFG
jgi:hypothetical protein